MTLHSRKMIFGLIAFSFLLAGAVLTIPWEQFAPTYQVYVGGILGVSGLVITGNVVGKFAAKKEEVPHKE